ncbi:hypothetical protein Tco_0808531, partial [Tanacetum coccineum]
METQKPLLKDKDGEEVDVHLYRLMIGSLMYLTSSRLDIMFAVWLWYPKDSPFDLVAYTDSDYARASLDRKPTTRAKPTKSKGFEQVVDFLNPSSIKYALTINPTIYTSCIEQFLSPVKAKTVNREVQLQALIDGKKIVVTEASVRRDLQLEDANGIDCLPNATIFEQLTLMGYQKLSQKLTLYKAFFSPQWKFLIHTILQFLSAKTTAWNEFSSTMASTIILFLENQLEGMINHNRIYIAPSHTKKVYANMKRQGNDFSGRVTPLKQRPRKPKRKDTEIPQSSVPMENIADEAVYEERDDSLERATTTTNGLNVEQDRGAKTMGDTITQTRSENVSKFSNDPLLARVNTPRSGEDSLQLKELMEFCTKLQQRVFDLENTKTAQAQEITSLKKRVKKLERKKKS